MTDNQLLLNRLVVVKRRLC